MQNQTKKVTEWEITTKRFVAYFDIMGFKDMIARSSHDKIYNMMKEINRSRKRNEKIKWKNSSPDLIRTTTYSDSIMVYSKDNSYKSLYSLICTVSALTNDLLEEKIPHKGGVAFGDMTLDIENSIFFGQPLVDAYLLQEELNFYGIIIHGSAEYEIDQFTQQKKEFLWLTNYLCPFKTGLIKHLTIHPIFASFSNSNSPDLKKKYIKLHQSIQFLRYNTSGPLRKYVDNTESYLNFIKAN